MAAYSVKITLESFIVKFQTFSQRVSAINIDVIHRIRHKNEQLEGRETFFSEALLRWSEINCTKDFDEFRTQVSAYGNTFNQLVHHETEVVAIVQSALLSCDSLALEPILDLVVQLARDLQTDFYKHFRQFFDILVTLLGKHAGNTEILEKTFVCLAYLFKFLWRYLVKDINEVYSYFSPLLGAEYKDYINTFAAESFAFLMRKCKDPSSLFDFMFGSLLDHPDRVAGVGRLLFEMVKGVRQQFHTICVTVFPVILSKVAPSPDPSSAAVTLPWQQVEGAIKDMLKNMAEYSTPQCLTPLWHILLTHINDCKNATSHEGLLRLHSLLNLTSVWLKYKHGIALEKPDQVAEAHVALLHGTVLPDDVMSTLLDNCVTLLISKRINLDLSSSARLVSVIFHSEYSHEIVFTFCRRLFDSSIFLTHVLPALLTRCASAIENSPLPTLQILTQIVLHKSPLDTESLCSGLYTPFTLNFGAVSGGEKVCAYLKGQVTRSHTHHTEHILWSSLVLLPHVRPLENTEELVTSISNKLKGRVKVIRKCQDSDLFMVYHLASCLVMLDSHDTVLQLISPTRLNKLLKHKGENIHALRLAELVMSLAHTNNATDFVNGDEFTTVIPFVESNLSSPWSLVRNTTLHILSKFQVFTQPETNVFEKCLAIENTPLSVQTYRDRVRLIEKLEFQHIIGDMPACVSMVLPLRYLASCFYANFTEIWPVVCRLVVSYAENMDAGAFWDTYHGLMGRAAADIACDATTPPSPTAHVTDLTTLHNSQFSLVTKHTDTPDLFNFRRLLWTTMAEFPTICELHSADVTSQFMTFLQNEYYTLDMMNAPSQNIKRDVDISGVDDDDEDAAADSDDDDDDVEVNDKRRSFRGRGKKVTTGKPIFKTLIAHLEVFAKFNKPQKLHDSADLHQLYLKLLLHQNEGIQQASLKCLLTYKHSSLTPYSERLERLVDEKHFKDELFELSNDATIATDHRTALVPIIMRILYGKMFGKTSHNQAKRNTRRSQIFRFLSACDTTELHTFVDLIFEPCQLFFSDDVVEKMRSIRDQVDLTNVLPLIRIQGILDAITLFLTKMGQHLKEFLPLVLQSILGFAAVCDGCLRQRDLINHHDTLRLKKIRQNSINVITQFLTDYTTYQYTAAEIDAVFELIVWPSLPNLPMNTQSPSPLLKLFHLFSQNYRYLSLLSKTYTEEDTTFTPLTSVYKLLLADHIGNKVVQMILAITSNLFNAKPPENGEETMIVVSDSLMDTNDSSQGDLTVGTRLLLPHVDALLTYIQGVVKRLAPHPSKLQHHQIELNLLSKVSDLVTDANQCDTLIRLLLPFMSRVARRSEETDQSMLTCILRLTKQSHNSHHFLLPVSKILTWLEPRISRNLVCDILLLIGEKNDKLKDVTTLVKQMNSWNTKRVDEPDYDLRLTTFETINRKINEMTEADPDFLIPIVHNTIHFMTYSDDYSLRDAASHCLVSLVDSLSRCLSTNKFNFNLIVCDNILPDLKAALRHKDQKVRDSFITILAALVKRFPALLHLTHLSLLFDDDPEVCFFTTITHIQTFKRTRALRRLQKFSTKYPLRHGLITSFLLPIVSPYLAIEYRKSSALQEAAIDAISSLCRRLPWTTYSQQLQHYLKLLPVKIEQQKLYIKVVVGILDAFTFDLSNSEYNTPVSAIKTADAEGKLDGEPSQVTDGNDTTGDIPQENVPPADDSITDTIQDATIPDATLTDATLTDSTTTDTTITDDNNPVDLGEKIVCSVAMATRIHKSIVERMIPQLYKCLTRKLHVLSFTVNMLLKDLEGVIKPGDIDSSIPSLVHVFNEELFGKVSDEKEVDGILSKLKEARVCKSYDSYEIVAKHAGQTSLMALLSPVKQVLIGTQSHKVSSKVEEVLKKIVYGLITNPGLDTQTLMMFVFGFVKDLPIAADIKKPETPKPELLPGQKPKSCLLLDKAPKRGGEKPKVDKKTNTHLLVEFAFNVLNMLLKKNLSPSDLTHASLCDPFLPLLTDALRSKYVKTISIALNCLRTLLKYPLPSLPTHINDVVNRLFILLKNYASSGAARGDNAELVTRCFQTVTVLVREVGCYELDREKLLVLLTFCEEDIFDFNRQSTAFNLLKAILKRQLVIPEIDELITKVEQLSVTADANHVHIQCRQVVLKYLLDYPLGKKITHHLEFYVSQLAYEYEAGRQSALEMCATFFSQFPLKILEQHAGLFFVPLSMVLVNDDSSQCKKLATLAIKTLLSQVQQACRNELFAVTLSWIKNKKVLLRTLSAQLWTIFVEIDATDFKSRLRTILPILCDLLDPLKYQTDRQDVGMERNLDQCLFNLLSTTLVILRHCELITKPSQYADSVYTILAHSHACLSHNHVWVGHSASQMFGYVFSCVDADELARAATSGDARSSAYLYVDTKIRLLGLVRDFCSQLQSQLMEESAADQIIKNLVFVMKVTRRISDLIGEPKQEVDPVTNVNKPQLCVLWVVKKVVNVANYEVKANINSNIRRKSVFKWLAAAGLELGPTHLEPVLPNMLPPLLREINEKSTTLDPDLKSLSHEVLEVLKSVVGPSVFTRIFSSVERSRVTRRQDHKLKRSIQMVADPELATRLKIKKAHLKRIAKKRKAESGRPPKQDLRKRRRRDKT